MANNTNPTATLTSVSFWKSDWKDTKSLILAIGYFGATYQEFEKYILAEMKTEDYVCIMTNRLKPEVHITTDKIERTLVAAKQTTKPKQISITTTVNSDGRPVKPDYSTMTEEEKTIARKEYQKAYDKWYNAQKKAGQATTAKPKTVLADIEGLERPVKPDYSGMTDEQKAEAMKAYQKAYDKWYIAYTKAVKAAENK